MKAYVLAGDNRIAALGDPVSEAPILARPLREVQRAALRDAGFEDVRGVGSLAEIPPGERPALVIGDDLWVTRSLVRAFVDASRAAGGIRQLAIPECRWLKDSSAAQELDWITLEGRRAAVFPMWWLGGGALDSASPLAVDADDEELKVSGVPKVFAPDGTLTIGYGARVAMRLSHWIHVLRANQLALLVMLGEAKQWPLWKKILGGVWIALKAFPPTSEARVLRALVRRGKKVKIHPSAVVEASILEDGVEIGAQAVVKASWLGKGAKIADGAIVDTSVFGEGASITRGGASNCNVLYPGAVLGSSMYQMSVVGRDAFIAMHVWPYDFKPDGEVSIASKGKIVSSGSRFLGVCFGHGCFVGAGVSIAHGREVPNGVRLIKDPRAIVQKFEHVTPDLPMVVDADGVARPLSAPLPGPASVGVPPPVGLHAGGAPAPRAPAKKA